MGVKGRCLGLQREVGGWPTQILAPTENIAAPAVPKLYAHPATVMLLWLARYRVWLTAAVKRNSVNYRPYFNRSSPVMKATAELMLGLGLCASAAGEQVKWLAPTRESTNSLGTLARIRRGLS